MMKDPVKEYVDWLRQHAVDLNKNIEVVKKWMSTQHTHNELFLESNELFLESIVDLRAEVKKLKKEIKELKEKK